MVSTRSNAVKEKEKKPKKAKKQKEPKEPKEPKGPRITCKSIVKILKRCTEKTG